MRDFMRVLITLVAVFTIAGVVVCRSPARADDLRSGAEAAGASTVAAKELAGEVSSSDLAFLGRVESTSRVGPINGRLELMVRFRVDSVLTGIALDSSVSVVVLGPHEGVVEGAEVLVQVIRNSDLNGWDYGFPRVIKGGVVQANDLRPAVDLGDLLRNSVSNCDARELLDRAVGLAEVELIVPGVSGGHKHSLPGGFWPCGRAHWLVPSGGRLPSLVRFSNTRLWPEDGYTYLVPIPEGSVGDTVTVGCGPARLEIRQGVVVLLGVSVERIPDVIRKSVGGRLELIK